MRTFLAIGLGLAMTFSSPDVSAEKPSKKVSGSKSKKKSKKSKKKSKRRRDAPGLKEFVQGVRFFKAKEYEAALPLFRKAYELSGHRRSTVLALAQCERALKMYDDAIAHYREYLAMDPPNAEKIRETVKLTEELLAAMGGSSKTPAAAPDAPASPQASAVTKTSTIALNLQVKPQSEAVSSPASAEAKIDSDSDSGSAVWIWTIGSILLVGGGAAAGYYFWPQPDPYGGTTGVIARPPGD